MLPGEKKSLSHRSEAVALLKKFLEEEKETLIERFLEREQRAKGINKNVYPFKDETDAYIED